MYSSRDQWRSGYDNWKTNDDYKECECSPCTCVEGVLLPSGPMPDTDLGNAGSYDDDWRTENSIKCDECGGTGIVLGSCCEKKPTRED